jgi:hypothetical protein
MSDAEIPPKPIPDPIPEPIAAAAPPPPVAAPLPSAATKPPPPPKSPVMPAKAGIHDLPAAKQKGSGIWPLVGLIAFLILAAGELYLYKLHLAQQDESAQIAALQSQLATLQQTAAQSQPAPTSPAAQATNTRSQANLNEKFDALTAQVAAMQNQLATDHGTITTIQADSTDLTGLTAKITLLNRLESARIALDSGQPLGDIPGAPPALAKYATTAPPTQAQLQLAYPAAAAAANNASVDKQDRGSVWQQALARVENLVTISNGSHVIVGAPAAAITAQAQQLLDAGDLAGAVATLTNGLSPTTQAALGNWLPQAESLLAARAAIVALADQK